jgi:hypothetical protein
MLQCGQTREISYCQILFYDELSNAARRLGIDEDAAAHPGTLWFYITTAKQLEQLVSEYVYRLELSFKAPAGHCGCW